METEKELAGQKKKIRVTTIVFIVTIIYLFLFVLTAFNYIPNYLNLETINYRLEEAKKQQTVSGSYNKSKVNCVDGWGDGCDGNVGIDDIHDTGKPVIYLYPTQPQDVSVAVDYEGEVVVTYPEYNDGWNVFAYPDGKIINSADNREYSYLFWEGDYEEPVEYDLSRGFVVNGSDTTEFLQDKLFEMGLTPKEYNEFIVYWMPKMLYNEYNLIHFANEDEYHNRAKLSITPEPDSVLRVFMVFKPLTEKITIIPQEFKPFIRDGFSVVEWGGTRVE